MISRKLLTYTQLQEFQEWIKEKQNINPPNNWSYYEWFMKEKGIVMVR